MQESVFSKIVGIVHDIKHFDAAIRKLGTDNDPMDEIMRFQFQHSKEQLFRELMVELLQSGISFSEFKNILLQLASYFEKSEKNGDREPLAPILKTSLLEAERLVAAA